MSIERAKAHLAPWGLDARIMEFDESSATVELAAAAVGTQPERIAKSLSFLVDGAAVLVVCAGDARIDNRRFKDTFHTKPKMISREQVEDLVGHGVGGVCPFGVNEGVRICLDESLKRFETVFPAAGSSNSAIELTLAELEQVTAPNQWVDLCKDWERWRLPQSNSSLARAKQKDVPGIHPIAPWGAMANAGHALRQARPQAAETSLRSRGPR